MYCSSQVVRRQDLDFTTDEPPVAWDYTPVSLAEMWQQLRLIAVNPAPDGFKTPEDETIMAYVAAITSALEGPEGWLGRVLTPQHWTLYLPTLSGLSSIKLPWGQLQSVTGITYTDTNGDEQTLDSSLYTVRAATGAKDTSIGSVVRVNGASWPQMKSTDRGVGLTFVAGYPVGQCDPLIKAYIRMCAATMFENREDVIIAPGALPYRLPGFDGILENKRIRGLVV